MALSLSREFALPPVTQEKVALSPDSLTRVQGFLHGISDVRKAIDTLLNVKERVVVGISGGSASGKSFVVDFLQSFYAEEGVTLSLDRYYRDEDEKPEEVSWDEPEALHLEEAKEHVAQLLKGEMVKVPTYSYLENKRMGYEQVQSDARVILLEGLYALSSSFTHDTSLYIHADEQSRLIRRVLRDVERKQLAPEQIVAFFHEVVLPKHRTHVEPLRERASFVVENPYVREIEKIKWSCVEEWLEAYFKE